MLDQAEPIVGPIRITANLMVRANEAQAEKLQPNSSPMWPCARAGPTHMLP